MAIAGPRVSTMEKHCFSVTKTSESATLLFTQNARKAHATYLASLASPH